MPKQARALRTYDRVLDAAAYEFARYGYTNANLQNIADRIRLTKGALYGHFANKEELAAALDHHLSATLGYCSPRPGHRPIRHWAGCSPSSSVWAGSSGRICGPSRRCGSRRRRPVRPPSRYLC